jgi:hypothetical protein
MGQARPRVTGQFSALLSPTSQRKRLASVIRAAGPRYTPRLNVDLPINSVFDGLGRTPAFFARIRDIQGKIQRAYLRSKPQKSVDAAQTQYKAVDDSIASIFAFFKRLNRIGDKEIGFLEVRDDIERTTEAVLECVSELRRLDDHARRSSEAVETVSGSSSAFSSEQHYLFQLRSALQAFDEVCGSTDALAANQSALLLCGVAGAGKTHLF